MLTRLDHLVILVHDLERAVADYERLGFAVTSGGEHADGLTRNALVPFGDGSYLELVSFLDPESPGDNVWGWREFLPRGGLIDYCAASEDLTADVRRLKDSGFGVAGPDDGGRRLPGGGRIRWRSARIHQEGRTLPFLIEDLTPRALRVPGGPAAEHPNGATGISRLEISTPHTEETRRALAALAGTPDAGGASFRMGACALSPVIPGPGSGEDHRLAPGPGPSAVELSARSPGSAGELDRRLTHGVRMRLARTA